MTLTHASLVRNQKKARRSSMLRYVRTHRRKVAALGVIPALLAGGAFAFFLTTSTGTAQLPAGTVQGPPPVAVTIYSVNASGTMLSHASDVWAGPGSKQTYYFDVFTGAAGGAYVNTLTLTGFTSNQTGCNSTALPGMFTMPAVVIQQVVSNPADYFSPAETVTLQNLAVDQSACVGASITLDFASN